MIFIVDKKNPTQIRRETEIDSDQFAFTDKTNAFNFAIQVLTDEIAAHNATYAAQLAEQEASHQKHLTVLNRKIDNLIERRDR